MQEDQSSYKSIAKASATFGGVKVIEIIVTIIKTKVVAILLGPEGMGVQSLFNSTFSMITQFSSLGIFQSSVRDISQAHQAGDEKQISNIVNIVKKWIWIVALLGAIICIGGSKFLSQYVFGSSEYTWQFILLSLAVLFASLSYGNITIMQGRRQLTSLAKASLIGASLSLIATIPLYYFLGVKGIVPAFVTGYLTMYVVNSYFVRKVKLVDGDVISLKEAIVGGFGIVKLGLILMFSNVLMTIFAFTTNLFISKYGTIADVGLFQAAFSVTYGNLIVLIAIMNSDYYPRLSAIHKDKIKVNQIVNQQIELLLLVISPITILLIMAAPLVVQILYSNEFVRIVPMLRWMSIALIFRVVWHSLSYVILANGDKKTYFIYDGLLGNGINFIINILAYYYLGLKGLAISFVLGAIFMSIILTIITYIKYDFKYSRSFWRLLFFFLVMSIISYIFITIIDSHWGYILCLLPLFITITTSIYVFNKRTNMFQFLKRKA